jgi:hypothetical protein
MDKNKTLAWNYAFEAIPILFHSSTSTFMDYLERKGNDILVFYWNHVGDRLAEEKRVSSAGLSFEIDEITATTRLVTITLPSPKEDGDPYFIAMVARPERRFAWVRIPNTEVYVLSRDDRSGLEYKTSYGYVSPRAIYQEKGRGVKPAKADFQRIIKNRLEKKK